MPEMTVGDIHITDKSIQRDFDALAKLDGGQVTIASRALDDKTWIVATTTEQRGERYYMWDRAKQKATMLFAARPELAQQPLVKMWPQVIKARDGLNLVSYLTLPASADANVDGIADGTAILPYYMPALLSEALKATEQSPPADRIAALQSLAGYATHLRLRALRWAFLAVQRVCAHSVYRP